MVASFLAPMKAVAGDLPGDADGWVFEVKWDGMRIVAHVDPAVDATAGSVRLVTTNGRDATDRFPELAGLDGAVPVDCVLDGEVVLLVDGVPDFGALQHRMHVATRAEAERRAAHDPVHYVVFDVLVAAGESVVEAPWSDRRRLLEQLLDPGPFWRVADVHDDGPALLEVARRRGLEGIVAKRTDGRYQPGRRSSTWRKVKLRDQRELVVGGWTTGEGARSGSFGALLLGHHVGGELRFVGRVGTGFDDAELRRLRTRLGELATDADPFTPPVPRATARVARFVRPDLVAEVAIGGWTPDRQIRHAAYLGLRPDVDPTTVTDRP